MKRELPRAILFDLDDTILGHGLPEGVFRPVAERHLHAMDGVTMEDLLRAFQRSRTWFWGDPERHKRGRLDSGAAREEISGRMTDALSARRDVIERIMAEYGAAREEGTRPFEGAVETLDWLRRAGVLLALVTNGTAIAQRQKIERFGLEKWFVHIQIEGELGMGKPEPEVYRHALDALDVSPHETWMVGDNLEWDVAAPDRLGIFGIWVDPYGRGLPESAHHVPAKTVRRIAELIPR